MAEILAIFFNNQRAVASPQIIIKAAVTIREKIYKKYYKIEIGKKGRTEEVEAVERKGETLYSAKDTSDLKFKIEDEKFFEKKQAQPLKASYTENKEGPREILKESPPKSNTSQKIEKTQQRNQPVDEENIESLARMEVLITKYSAIFEEKDKQELNSLLNKLK